MKPFRLVALLIGAAGAIVALSCEEQQATSPQTARSLSASAAAPANDCVADKDHGKKAARVQILCAITVPGNPLTNVAKGWFSHEQHAVYIADQSNTVFYACGPTELVENTEHLVVHDMGIPKTQMFTEKWG